MAKVGKIDFKKVAMNAVITAGTGAAAQVLKEAVLPENPEMMDYVMIGAGLVLPELVKSPEISTVGNAMLAIGAYRMSDRLGLAEKLGVNTVPATAGLPTQHVVGSGWTPSMREKKSEKEATVKSSVVS